MGVCMCEYICICSGIFRKIKQKEKKAENSEVDELGTAIPIIIEGRFQNFQRFSSGNLVLITVESCFVALNHYGNGSTMYRSVCVCMYEYICISTIYKTTSLMRYYV